MEDGKVVTLEMIAQRLSLSRSTVCYALNGTGTLSASTRSKIIQTAGELGYHPNLHASALTQQRTLRTSSSSRQLVAVLYHTSDEYPDVPADSPELQQHAHELGLEHKFYNLRNHPNLAAFGRILRARGYSGIIINRIMDNLDMKDFPWEHFSVTVAGRQIGDWPFDVVREGTANTLEYAFQKAAQLGYKRPGVSIVHHSVPIRDDHERLGHILAHNQLSQYKKKIPPFFETYYAGVKLDNYFKKYLKWFERYRPDVVLAFPVFFCHVLREAGWKVPGDTSYISLQLMGNGNDPWHQSISGFIDCRQAVLKAALDHVSFLIRHNRMGISKSSVEVIINPEWSEGLTLPAKN